MTVKMSRAFDISGNIVSIDDVRGGKACGCRCIDCDEPLVAKKGAIYKHHFSHEPSVLLDGVAEINRECHWMPESDLHILAKEVLAEDKQLSLPIGMSTQFSKRIAFDSMQLEFPEGSRIPDVIGYVNGEKILIEIAVSNFCGPEKIKYLRSRFVTCLELDFRDFPMNVEVLSKDKIRTYLEQCPKRWLSIGSTGSIAEEVKLYERGVMRDLTKDNNKLKAENVALKHQQSRLKAMLAGHQPEIDKFDAEIAFKKGVLANIQTNIGKGVDRLNAINAEVIQQRDLLLHHAERLEQLDQLDTRSVTLERNEKAVAKRLSELDEEVQLRVKGLSTDLDKRELSIQHRLNEFDALKANQRRESCKLRVREVELSKSEADFYRRVNQEAERLAKDMFVKLQKDYVKEIRMLEDHYLKDLKLISEARQKFASQVKFPDMPPAMPKFNGNITK